MQVQQPLMRHIRHEFTHFCCLQSRAALSPGSLCPGPLWPTGTEVTQTRGALRLCWKERFELKANLQVIPPFGISFPFKLGIGITNTPGPGKVESSEEAARERPAARGRPPRAGGHMAGRPRSPPALHQTPCQREAGGLGRHSPSRMAATMWAEGEVSTDRSPVVEGGG